MLHARFPLILLHLVHLGHLCSGGARGQSLEGKRMHPPSIDSSSRDKSDSLQPSSMRFHGSTGPKSGEWTGFCCMHNSGERLI